MSQSQGGALRPQCQGHWHQDLVQGQQLPLPHFPARFRMQFRIGAVTLFRNLQIFCMKVFLILNKPFTFTLTSYQLRVRSFLLQYTANLNGRPIREDPQTQS